MSGQKVKNRISLQSVWPYMIVFMAFLVILAFVTLLVMPKYSESLEEGSMICQYYDEAEGHQVVFVGDCEVYANISPMELYRESGITSYVRGNSQQLMWQSYYVVEETFKYETPELIVLNVNSMRYNEPVKEEFNRLAMDRMRWSSSKLGMIKASMTDEENIWSYVFLILRYHSRITELTDEDFKYLFEIKYNTWNGFQMNKGVMPLETLPAKKKLVNYDFDEICWEYLERIRLICAEHGTQLVLMKAPSAYPYWYDEYDAQIEAYAAEHGLTFYNFLDNLEEIGIDYATDTYDAGLHLNIYGAEKLSRFAAQRLSQDFGLADMRKNESVKTIYDEKLIQYDAERENK